MNTAGISGFQLVPHFNIYDRIIKTIQLTLLFLHHATEISWIDEDYIAAEIVHDEECACRSFKNLHVLGDVTLDVANVTINIRKFYVNQIPFLRGLKLNSMEANFLIVCTRDLSFQEMQ